MSASAAVTSFVLRLVGRRVEKPETKLQAANELAQLVDKLLHENITEEEADFISEMVKGVNVQVIGKVGIDYNVCPYSRVIILIRFPASL